MGQSAAEKMPHGARSRDPRVEPIIRDVSMRALAKTGRALKMQTVEGTGIRLVFASLYPGNASGEDCMECCSTIYALALVPDMDCEEFRRGQLMARTWGLAVALLVNSVMWLLW
jgi:hypothetical protein